MYAGLLLPKLPHIDESGTQYDAMLSLCTPLRTPLCSHEAPWFSALRRCLRALFS